MSNLLKTVDVSDLNRALIGFDQIFNDRFFSQPSTKYPPYNYIQYDENHYGLEFAVAGFNKEDIAVRVDQNQLIITGSHSETEETRKYLHRGIAAREFERVFTLAEHMVVQEATVENGMLHIAIDRVIPEALKPRLIEIK